MEDRRKITVNTPLHIFTTCGEKRSFVLLNLFSNFRSALPLLSFVSFGTDIDHIDKWLQVNSKSLFSSSLSPPSSQFSRKPFIVCSTAHCGSFRCQIQVAGNIPARACFDPSINFDMMLHLSRRFSLSLIVLYDTCLVHTVMSHPLDLFFILIYCNHLRFVIKIQTFVCRRHDYAPKTRCLHYCHW